MTCPSHRRPMRGRLLAAGAIALAGIALGGAAHAGGGPENVVVVVNASSPGSKEVANHYVRLRDIPATNVVALDYSGPVESASGEVFREQILRPVIEEIARRGLGAQIDVVAYSTDFPWRITLGGDFPAEPALPKHLTPNASLTGATFLFGFVFGKNPGVVSFDSNWYYATAPGQPRATNLQRCRQLGAVPSRGFRARDAWTADGTRSADPKVGRHYLLASMLGVTTGRGNTVAEIKASLDRAVEAEASPPEGRVYFMRNGDVRSLTRHACYDAAAEQVRQAGGDALVQVGVCPTGAQDITGLMTGAADLDLGKARLGFRPGAFCEHLTSAGGILFKPGFQTPLTDLIRAGATGACGAVEEPYAIQAKFPTPALQVHYRRGCSLAEAFYQSVAAPYQLLLVGDPLCQPWATRPDVRSAGWPGASAPGSIEPGGSTGLGFDLLGLEAPAATTGPETLEATSPAAESDTPPTLSLRPVVTSAGVEGGVWELFVDGKLTMRLSSGTRFAMTDEQLGPGWHELRLVGLSADPLETQRLRKGALVVPRGERDGAVTLRIDSESTALEGRVAVSVSAPNARRIVIRHNWREVASVGGARGGALIPAELLGRGPVRLQAIAEPGGARSRPAWTRIE